MSIIFLTTTVITKAIEVAFSLYIYMIPISFTLAIAMILGSNFTVEFTSSDRRTIFISALLLITYAVLPYGIMMLFYALGIDILNYPDSLRSITY